MKHLHRPGLILLAVAVMATNAFAIFPCCRRGCPASASAWAGIYPTVLTPTTCDGIDTAALDRQIRYQLQGGVHGLLVLGTIGEGHLLNDEERGQVIATTVKTAGKTPVVVGIHTCDVDIALAQMRQAKKLGASAVLVKYYGDPRASADTVLAFFTALSDSGILPIIFYHYPSDTGLCLPAHVVAAILRLANVIGIKESTLNLRDVEAHIRLSRDLGKSYFSGTALNLTQFMELGGHGAMCPEAALLPGSTVAVYEAWQQGDCRHARRLQGDLFQLAPILSSCRTSPALARCTLMTLQDMKIPVPMTGDPSPVKLKYALNLLGVATPITVRPPQQPLRRCDERQIEHAVGRMPQRALIVE